MSRKRRLFGDDDEGPPVKLFEFMPRNESKLQMAVDCECGAPNNQHLLPPTPGSSRRIDAVDLGDIVRRYILMQRDKIGQMNLDTLERIVHYSGAQPHSRVFIYEESLGLVMLSVAYKMNGVGELTILHNGMNPGNFPVLSEVGDLWDFKTLILVRLSSVAQIERKRSVSNFATMESDAELMDYNDGQTTSTDTPTISWNREKFLPNSTLDATIIVANLFNPAEILAETYPKLGTGGRIIVYSNSKEKIDDVYAFLIAHEVLDLNVHNQQEYICGPTTGYLITAFKP